MTNEEFNAVFKQQLRLCQETLRVKAQEYAPVDRLRNFKVAAAVQGKTPRMALAGMMAKHTVSLYDMLASPGEFVMDLWNEKITDHINYLFLLKALLVEEYIASRMEE